MKNFKYIFFIVSFFLNQNVFSQNMSDFFRELLKQDYIKELLEDKESVIFSNTRYLYVITGSDNSQVFKEYFFVITTNTDLILITENNIENELLKAVFDKKMYKKGYYDLNSSFYKGKDINQAGLPTYFTFISKNGTNYCEYFLPYLMNVIPYSKKINFLITQRFGNHIGLNYIPDYSN